MTATSRAGATEAELPPTLEAAVHVVSIAELTTANRAFPWDDPDGIAEPTAGKLQAILANPLSESPDDPAQLVGTYGGRVIGRLDVLPGRIDLAGEGTSCLVASALYVAPEYRHVGMGALLLLRLQQLHHTVVACGVSQQAYPLYSKLRWLDLPMQRHVSVRRSRAIMKRFAPSWAAPAAAVVCDAALAAFRAATVLPARRRLRHLSCDEVAELPADVAALITPARDAASFHRSAAWIHWVVGNSFDSDRRDRRGLFVVRTKSGAPVAYFVATARVHETASRYELPELCLGSLQDWVIFEDRHVDQEQLVLLALRELLRWRVDAVEVCLGPTDAVDRLWRWGFRRAGDLHLLIKAGPRSPLRDAAYARPGTWRLRPADGDNAL